MELTHGGTFEGIGGFSEGARRAGLKTIWFSEINNYKQNILKQHFPDAHLYGSIFKIQNPPYVDIITGGFPCTDISAAGGRTGIFGDSSSLYTEMYRVAAEGKPRYIVFENSPFLSGSGMEYILHDLSRLGYDAEWTCLRADWFGHRHKRKRIFIIAYPLRKRSIQRFSSIFKSISDIFPQREISKQTYLPGLLERFDGRSDTNSFRANTGISHGLDKAALHAIGDSVNVDIANYLFECIKLHHANNK